MPDQERKILMPRMTLKAVHADSERRRWTLHERIVDEDLGSYSHVPQVQLALDDFGAGYSSLGSLQRFPPDQIKLDRTLIDTLCDGRGVAVVRAAVELGRALWRAERSWPEHARTLVGEPK